MDKDWLTSWLQELNLYEYHSCFHGNGHHSKADLCSSIREITHLKDIGVDKLGHRNRLMRAIDKLRTDSQLDETELPPPPPRPSQESSTPSPDLSNHTDPVAAGTSVAPGRSSAPVPKPRHPRPARPSLNHAPPVPQRRSFRKVVSSPCTSRTPTPEPDDPSQEELLPPPPVMPRAQSLRRRSGSKPATDARVSDDIALHMSGRLTSVEPKLAPIPQSPVVGAVVQEPLFPSTVPQVVAGSGDGRPQRSSADSLLRSQPPLHNPVPKPRRTATKKPSVPDAPTTSSSEEEVRQASPIDSESVLNNGRAQTPPPVNGVTSPVVLEAPPTGEEEEEEEGPSVPTLPLKKSKLVMPSTDVVFELEDALMPQVPLSNGSAPPLPSKDAGGPPSFSPELPPKEAVEEPLTAHGEGGPLVITPDLPLRTDAVDSSEGIASSVTDVPSKHSNVPPNFTPELPPKASSGLPNVTPEVPPRKSNGGPPNFTPELPPKESPGPPNFTPELPHKDDQTLPVSEALLTKKEEVEEVPNRPQSCQNGVTAPPPVPNRRSGGARPQEPTLLTKDPPQLAPPPPVRQSPPEPARAASRSPATPRQQTAPPAPPPRVSTLQKDVPKVASNPSPFVRVPSDSEVLSDDDYKEDISKISSSKIPKQVSDMPPPRVPMPDSSAPPPPLPRRTSGPPPFKPLPPPTTNTTADDELDQSDEDFEEGVATTTTAPSSGAAAAAAAAVIKAPPVLPPKEEVVPPPPPPITDDDYPVSPDYTDSEEGEGAAPLISIASSSTNAQDDILLTNRNNFTNAYSTSPESTPEHRVPTLIRQRPSDDRDDSLLLIIGGGPASGTDYENQETIDQVLSSEDETFARENLLPSDTRFQIKGTAPIKSRTLGREDAGLDYENQEVLDEDIIPFLTLSANAQPSYSQAEGASNRPKPSYLGWNDEPTSVRTTVGFEAEEEDREAGGSGVVVVCDSESCQLVGGRRSQPPVAAASPTRPDPTSSTFPRQSERLSGVMAASGGGDQTKPRSQTTLMVDDGLDRWNSGGSGSSSVSTTPGSTEAFSLSGSGGGGGGHSLAVSQSEPLLGGRVSRPSSEYLDGSGPAFVRSLGTFAGTDAIKQQPSYRKMVSYDSGSVLEGSTTSDLLSPFSTRMGSASLQFVPKTKEGYLFKKGGRRSERPWQKRWVTFNGSELKYFKNKGDKDKESRNIVQLAEMIDIKQVQDPDKAHRFDLVVINRVFQFYSDLADESESWVNVLHAAITRFKPQEHEFKAGGNMHSPEKQGVLLKQGHGTFGSKAFKERYVALKGPKFAYYESKELFAEGKPINTLDMCLGSVRPDYSAKLPRFIITMNNQKSYVFQASSEAERKEWLDMITTAIMTGLNTRQQTLKGRRSSRTNSEVILAKVQENSSNKVCADCADANPVWGVVNLGIMVCINCSGVHRSMGTHISKVRSVELDQSVWTDKLIKVMILIGNDNSNQFWEHHCRQDRLPASVEREIRENFIRSKYQTKCWVPRCELSKEELSHQLCAAILGDDLMDTVRLLTQGADACFVLPDSEDPENNSVLALARSNNQDLQAELLEQNGALVCSRPPSTTPGAQQLSRKGYLYKTGTDRTGWRRRYCSLDTYRGFEYFKSEGETEALGYIRLEEMLSVSRCEEELSRDPTHRHCFEVNTQSRGYLLCAETEEDMDHWVGLFNQIISSDAADNLGYDKVGYLKKKDSHNVGVWKRRWFTLKGKSLVYYKREREEVSEIDLRKVVELKPPEASGTAEHQTSFQIILQDKTHHLRADSSQEAELWYSALKHTQVSGIPLAEQQLTTGGIPILVHKCLQYVESFGMEQKGLYRLSGEKAKIRKLILEFNQDARGVVIDPEKYLVNDVTGTLKQFFQSLPDPLLTHQLYPSFISTMQTTGSDQHEAQLYQLQALIEQLPTTNRETLRRLMGHLKKVADFESKNKMGLSNLVKLFGPTLMTVDGDPVSFDNTPYEYSCIHKMVECYKWLFQVDEAEEKKEEAIVNAVQKIKEAEMKSKVQTISSSLDFLTTIYIGNKEGESLGTKITATTLVAEVVEQVVTTKAMPPNNYALYLVLGDSESHRVLGFSERLLAVLCSTGSDCFLCLKPNLFADTLQPYIDTVGESCVNLQVRERKKWKKYPCAVKAGHFVQYRDPKGHHEAFKLSVQEFDVFAGIERSRMDVKNPMPTRYCFWIKAMRGEENCRYLCADSEPDMLRVMAAIVKSKYPDCLQSPLLPAFPPPVYPPPTLDQPPPGVGRRSPQQPRESDYANVKFSGKLR